MSEREGREEGERVRVGVQVELSRRRMLGCPEESSKRKKEFMKERVRDMCEMEREGYYYYKKTRVVKMKGKSCRTEQSEAKRRETRRRLDHPSYPNPIPPPTTHTSSLDLLLPLVHRLRRLPILPGDVDVAQVELEEVVGGEGSEEGVFVLDVRERSGWGGEVVED